MSPLPATPSAEGTNLLYAPQGQDLEWQEQGLCRDRDPELWFPERPQKAIKERKALRVCRSCPVMGQCAIWALTVQEEYGVWGNTTEESRRDYWRKMERPLRRRWAS